MKTTPLNSNKTLKKNIVQRKIVRSTTNYDLPILASDLVQISKAIEAKEKNSQSKSPVPNHSEPNKGQLKRAPSRSQTQLLQAEKGLSTAKNSKNSEISLIFSETQGNKNNSGNLVTSASSSPSKYQRKDSRSQTEVNTPVNSNSITNFQIIDEESQEKNKLIRQNSRNKTELILSKNEKNPKDTQQELTKKKGFNYKSNKYGEEFIKNYKIEETPARVYHKEKIISDNPFVCNEITVQEISIFGNDGKKNELNLEKNERKSLNDRSSNSIVPKSKRASIGSNGSSIILSEAHHELLFELTKSVHELNHRLIRNEEISKNRMSENLSLKSAIRDLESRLDEQKNPKLDEKSVNVGCTNGCLVF